MKKLTYIVIALFILSLVVYANILNEKIIDCDEGSAQACYEAAETYTAQSYKQKESDANKSAQKVIELYKKSCELGYAKGCSQYGMSYAADTQKDTAKNDAYYFKKACDMGDETGCTMLKMMTLRQ